jgi:3-oxoacyl-(acyl-carrier-protein) synthase
LSVIFRFRAPLHRSSSKLMNNAATSHVSMQYNLRGPSFTATACASSNHAMGQAFYMIGLAWRM